MPKVSPQDKARFARYVNDASLVVENLGFLLDNLGEQIELDYSLESLAASEAVFWRCVKEGIPGDLSDPDHFAQLLGQYLGECIIRHTGAKWVQSDEHNPMFAQPCIDGFGGQVWDRVYPVHTALNYRRLAADNPSFPGLREKRLFAAKLERALAIYDRHRSSEEEYL